MSIEFKLPELGENITSGDIVKVLVHEGQEIRPNESAFELETDKAVVEIPARDGGTVVKIHVGEGQKVNVGQVLLTIEPAEAETSAEPAAPAAAPAAPSEPRLSGSGKHTEPAVSAPSGSRLGLGEKRDADETPGGPEPAAAHDDALIPAGPVARRTARELGVDLSQIAGSGPHGRITPEDVEHAAARRGSSPKTAPAGLPSGAGADIREPVTPPGRADHDAWGPVRRDRISQIRRTIAKHMSHSATTIPHVTNFDDADVTELDALRRGVPPGYLGPGIKLTMMPLVLRAVATALRQHPLVNASLDEENDEIVYKEYVNLGVAVDTPRGLVVPVLRGVDRMTIPEIAEAVGRLAEQARGAQFAIEDLRGGTFTVSNLGAVGGTYSTPIINHPEAALLLLGRSRRMPVARDDRIETRLMLPLSLSYDHRLVDGATAGRFLNQVIDLLESPGKLVLA
ncbi:MAG: 2-oxo acid dehydrogenase subunit E2 [Pirellulales bacterium]|nr:2-oxo acid dehydrogenase subunit E2 [Pirellulales bacterium]